MVLVWKTGPYSKELSPARLGKLVKIFEGVNRTGMGKPYQPSYGMKGNPVEFQTYYFALKFPSTLVLYRYRTTIDPDYSDGKQLPEPNNNELK